MTDQRLTNSCTCKAEHWQPHAESCPAYVAKKAGNAVAERLRMLRKTVEYFAHSFRREGGASTETIAELTEAAEVLQSLENAPETMQPMNPACRAPWMPLTLEDIRKVIREELDRKPTPDSASEQLK